jgi:UDP-4-amino-4-deoxy-L-arabinose-oxoglutarate aminotransferase
MRENFLPFSRPSMGEEEITAVSEVLRSGWITTGPKNVEFEKRFGEYTGSPHSVALGSATAGMHLLFKALNLKAGDEVITPSMTWVSTVNLIVLAGATPVFADIDRDTLMVSPDTIEPCLSHQTKLIIPVHFAGAPADLVPLREQARAKNIRLIEDAAHAVGTEYKGEKIGMRGTSIFSFHPIKNMTTGEGGMVCSDDAKLVEKIRRLKFHGLGVDAYDRKAQGRSPQAEVQEPGYKYNLPDMLAALGIVQLRRIEEFNRKRAELARLYLDLLSDIDEILPLSVPGKNSIHAWHLFVIRVDTDKTGFGRDEFMEEMKKRNIGTGIHFRAVHQQKFYRDTRVYRAVPLPNTEWNSDRICSLPLFPEMSSDDVQDVVTAIKDILAKHKRKKL